ncbi:MAG TPA: 3-oxoacyl-[acyl-carrier-protein] reductase [Planctomycetota bacterium]|nr:3-oxoacyl-[acyl-carrier-protein] reductase [Planctomycetota bacterium]
MSPGPGKLEGQVAIETGASRGIGRAIAFRLAEDGASLALLARSLDGVEKVAADIQERFPGAQVLAQACDISSSKDVIGAVEAVLEKAGRIDILVNNAGITRDNLLLRMSEAEWDDVMATNLKGLFNASKAVARHMLRERRGRIINITSVVGLIGNAGQVNYAASKGGVIAFTFSLAKELASRGITVNAVAPGFIETDMTARMTDEARAQFAEKIPVGRLGRVEEVAGIVAFLACPSAGYITGEVIRVDGGLAIG